jgi:hypothetical protein
MLFNSNAVAMGMIDPGIPVVLGILAGIVGYVFKFTSANA